MCWHRLNRLVHLSHELRKPIGGDEHVNPLDRPGLDALQDFAPRPPRSPLRPPRAALTPAAAGRQDWLEYCLFMLAWFPPRFVTPAQRTSRGRSGAFAAATAYKGIPRHSRGIPLHSNESIS